ARGEREGWRRASVIPGGHRVRRGSAVASAPGGVLDPDTGADVAQPYREYALAGLGATIPGIAVTSATSNATAAERPKALLDISERPPSQWATLMASLPPCSWVVA